MDLEISAEDRRFREEVRTWLAENVPREPRPEIGPEARAFDLAWQRKQYDGGWAGVAWPREYGGRGLSLLQQMIWFEEYARAGGPYIGTCFVGINHAGPTLIARGSEAQKSFHLPRILRGDVVWCQGFSEPSAGSDLASLKTRAVIEGDQLVVTGQKIWTSFAQLADYQELLVRTSSEGRKHHGITWVICDMHSPGVEVRPIVTMSGGAEFCEVFYADVRIPLANVVGRVDDGWSVAMSTLGFERGTGFIPEQMALQRDVEELIAEARTRIGPDGRRPAIADEEIARRLAQLRAETAAVRAMTLATVSRARRQPVPGPEGSLVKIFFSDIRQRMSRLAMQILGDDALVLTGMDDGWTRGYLRSYAATLGGGTSEIQRNIVAERILGLPKDAAK
jgi:alkylation response protein AidB-like acyl-CoA dehydrogenase